MNSSSRATPMPRPASAVITGRPMATTEPKASNMMMSAAVMPIPSLGPGAAVTAAEIGLPPSATWKPGRASAWAVETTFLIAAGRDVRRVGAELHLGEGDVAMRRDLVGAGRRERARSPLARRAAAARRPPPCRWPPGCRRWAWRCGTRCPPMSPACDGKRAARMFCACCDGVLPAVNLFLKSVPTTWATTVIADDGDDPEHEHEAPPVVAVPGQPSERGHRRPLGPSPRRSPPIRPMIHH